MPNPKSANTETIVCKIDCSGNTQTIVPPHATYSNENGEDVIQLNTIQLGGQNGLYA